MHVVISRNRSDRDGSPLNAPSHSFILLYLRTGKSTLINILVGLVSPTGGEILVPPNGLRVSTDLFAIRRLLGVCPQHDILYPELTVTQHLQLFGALKGLSGRDLEVEVERMIVEVGLEEKALVRSASLSGGQKRKLSLGMALIGDSKIIILDGMLRALLSMISFSLPFILFELCYKSDQSPLQGWIHAVVVISGTSSYATSASASSC